MSAHPKDPQTQRQKISPFKDEEAFEKELQTFANKYRTILSEHSRRISDYFEMSCFNMVVRYYEHQGFIATAENLQTGRFRYKCSPAGLIENFSNIKLSNGDEVYRVYHNASVQSAHDEEVFTTPDIVVASNAEPMVTTDYYKTKKRFSFLSNKEILSFCEAKHHTPFPELMINFIGTVNELKPLCIQQGGEAKRKSVHIAPALMMSGSLSKPTEKLAKSLERRYYVNILGDLFLEPYSTTFSLLGVRNLATLVKKREYKSTEQLVEDFLVE